VEFSTYIYKRMGAPVRFSFCRGQALSSAVGEKKVGFFTFFKKIEFFCFLIKQKHFRKKAKTSGEYNNGVR